MTTVVEHMEDKIRKILVPELELELMDVTALQWEELSQNEKEQCEAKSKQLLESTISKILDVEEQEIQNKVQEKQRKNTFRYRCTKCPNRDQKRFVEIEGSIICCGINDKQGCGYEMINYKQHEGNFYRSFAGEDDRSHHGKPFNPLYSEAWNSRISSSSDSLEKESASKFKATIAKVEDDLDKVNRDVDDHRTRDSYRDKHKSKVFESMKDVISNLCLHSSIEKRAQYLFSIFRDDRDRVQREKLVTAACLVIAYRENVKELAYEESLKKNFSSSSSSSSSSSLSSSSSSSLSSSSFGQNNNFHDNNNGNSNDNMLNDMQKRKKFYKDLENEKLERKRIRDEEMSKQVKFIKDYNENDVKQWLENICFHKFNGIEIQTKWKKNNNGGNDPSSMFTTMEIAKILSDIKSNDFINKIILKLNKNNKTNKKTLGQVLLLSNAKTFNVCECEKGSIDCFCAIIGQEIFKELKVAKEHDMLQLSRNGDAKDSISRKFGLIRKKPRN